jgi:hypothetical protein
MSLRVWIRDRSGRVEEFDTAAVSELAARDFVPSLVARAGFENLASWGVRDDKRRTAYVMTKAEFASWSDAVTRMQMRDRRAS